jgi:hypothetical protein
MTKPDPDRDCEHGQLARVCDRCADAKEIKELRAMLDRERSQRKQCADIASAGFEYLLRAVEYKTLPIDVARAEQALRALRT